MGFRLEVTGGDPIKFDERAIINAEFSSLSPHDSNARATDYGMELKIWGKMLFSLGGQESDSTLNVSKWSRLPSEDALCYRSAKLDVIAAGNVVRQFELPHAFGMDYTEELDDETGVGTFYLHMKQKKDQTRQVKLEGGFAGE